MNIITIYTRKNTCTPKKKKTKQLLWPILSFNINEIEIKLNHIKIVTTTPIDIKNRNYFLKQKEI